MKLYLMKRDALIFFKDNLEKFYAEYYRNPTNDWMTELYGDNPFVEFKELPDFNLTTLDGDLTRGEIDHSNCKIIYEKLMFLSESQACDERLWAGLANATFYQYMRKKWGYGYNKKPKTSSKEAGELKTRFFFESPGKSGFYRNTLSKCWWVGRNTYDPVNKNHFEKLDIIGSNDITSKISEIFYSYVFSANPTVLNGIVKAFDYLQKEGIRILARDHIRRAMQDLNAIGGTVILDCLGEDDIADLVINSIQGVIQGDTPAIELSTVLPEDEDIDSEGEDESVEEGTEKVVLGCKIFVRNDDGDVKIYSYDYKTINMIKALRVFEDKCVGDKVTINDEEYVIEKISVL